MKVLIIYTDSLFCQPTVYVMLLPSSLLLLFFSQTDLISAVPTAVMQYILCSQVEDASFVNPMSLLSSIGLLSAFCLAHPYTSHHLSVTHTVRCMRCYLLLLLRNSHIE